jgi:Dynein heavy chain, N-terminal region 1
VLPPTS